MATTHIVTVGTRSSTNFTATSVIGSGPWEITVQDMSLLDSTVTGDVMQDPFLRVYLVTGKTSTSLFVRDINAAGGLAPFTGLPLPFNAWTQRAYMGIGTAQMDIPDVVTSNDDTWECHVYNDSTVLENMVWIDDVTLSQNGTIKITVPESERHTGKKGTGATWGQFTSGYGMYFYYSLSAPPAHQILEWLEIKGVYGGSFNYGIFTYHGGASTVLRNLIVHQYSSSNTTLALVNFAPNFELTNCVVHDVFVAPGGFSAGLYNTQFTAGTGARIRNCTFDACHNYAVRNYASLGLALLQNCVAIRSGSSFVAFTQWDAASDYNGVDAGSAPGLNSLFGLDIWGQFVFFIAGDYHLLPTSPCVGAGLDLSTEFTDDYDAQTRAGAWDIGADQLGRAYYVDSGTGSNSNDGKSPAKAWETIAHVNTQTFAPGDTIRFRGGQEYNGQIEVADSGSAGRPITYGAYGTGDRPIIGFDVKLANSGWTLRSGSSVTYWIPHTSGLFNEDAAESDDDGYFRHLTRTNSAPAVDLKPGSYFWDAGALRVYVRSYDTVSPDPNTNGRTYYVTDSKDGTSDPESKFGMDTKKHSYIHIQDLHFACGWGGCEIGGRNVGGSPSDASKFCKIRNCRLSGTEGMGIGVHQFASDIEVEANDIRWCGNGMKINQCNNVVIFNNTIRNLGPIEDWADAPKIDLEGMGLEMCTNTKIYGNMVSDARNAIGTFALPGASLSNIEVYNNSFVTPFSDGLCMSGRGGTVSNFVMHHNLIVSHVSCGFNVHGPNKIIIDPANPVKIYHNTIFAESGGNGPGLRIANAPVEIKNNIQHRAVGHFMRNEGPCIGNAASTWNYNCWFDVPLPVAASVSWPSNAREGTNAATQDTTVMIEDDEVEAFKLSHSELVGYEAPETGGTITDWVKLLNSPGIVAWWCPVYSNDPLGATNTIVCLGRPGIASNVAWELYVQVLYTVEQEQFEAYQMASSQGASDIVLDPQFDPASSEFQLSSGSPCRNTGTTVPLPPPKNDFAGNPLVGLPDMGALEFQG